MAGSLLDITAHKQIEQELRRSEQQQRILIEQLEQEKSRLAQAQAVAKVGSWETDMATMEILWSEETYRIFETSAEALSPNHAKFLEFVHPEDRQRVDLAFKRSLQSEAICAIEHRIVVAGGREKWVEECWQTFRAGNATATKAVGTCRDITEAKLAQDKLNQNTRRLEATAAMAEAFNQGRVLADAMDVCAAALVTYVDAAAARVWTLDLRQERLQLQASGGSPVPNAKLGSSVSLQQFPLGAAAHQRRPFLLAQASLQPAEPPQLAPSEWLKQQGVCAVA
ncbi:MAG: PAS domain-containing protein, partial [Planctomycetales bacterium]|nr:PAS domain-containing protein [Planctomycetales bacterium]